MRTILWSCEVCSTGVECTRAGRCLADSGQLPAPTERPSESEQRCRTDVCEAAPARAGVKCADGECDRSSEKEQPDGWRREVDDLLHAISVLFAIQPEGDCLAERKPTKDDHAYRAFAYLNDQVARVRAILAQPVAAQSARAEMPTEGAVKKEREAVLMVVLRQLPGWKWGHIRRLVESDARKRGVME